MKVLDKDKDKDKDGADGDGGRGLTDVLVGARGGSHKESLCTKGRIGKGKGWKWARYWKGHAPFTFRSN